MKKSRKGQRKQFSSCDSCRQSRLACDASRHGHRAGQARWQGSCSRCSQKQQRCTFKWIEDVLGSTSGTPRSSDPGFEVATSQACIAWQRVHMPSDGLEVRAMTRMFEQQCDLIFEQGHETLCVSWIGAHGCPLVKSVGMQEILCPVKLFRDLDAYISRKVCDSAGLEDGRAALQDRPNDLEVEQALQYAIRAFAARWLPAVAWDRSIDLTAFGTFARDAWRAARTAMSRVINSLCYRSVLTLYLFSQSPVPLGISKDEELTGLTATVCSQTALLQVQQLRDQMRPLVRALAAETPEVLERYLDLETRAYWLATMWDTAGAMSLNVRSSMTSGLKGACSEPTWRLVRSFLTEAARCSWEQWTKTDWDSQPLMTSQILPVANVCRLYIWKNITSMKEALREGVDEESLQQSWTSLLEALESWRAVVYTPLKNLEARLPSLAQTIQLSWFEVNLHHNLGLLKLTDALEVGGRTDLALQLGNLRLDAEYEASHALEYGLVNTYNIDGMDQRSDVLADSPRRSATTSLVAIYPHPESVVSLVRLLSVNVRHGHQNSQVTSDEGLPVLSTLHKVLEELPPSTDVCALQQSLHRPPHVETSTSRKLGPQ